MSADSDGLVSTFSPADAVRAGLAAADRAAFHASTFYREHGEAFESWIGALRSGVAFGDLVPPPSTSVRIVHWNIEQGKRWDRIVEAIDLSPLLREADLWTVNESEIGMARSANRHVTRSLAERLGFHWVFVPDYFELTKGPGADRLAPGENAIGLHGSALLSRWPLEDPGSAVLPEIFDYFAFPEEKRYGSRRVLWATVRHPNGPFRLATAHLEVRNSPKARARQMAAALRALPDGDCWFAGDWNTHTFQRGTLWRTAREFLRLTSARSEALDRQLREPWEREPLLGLAEQAGFRLGEWNDASPTARELLSGVEELSALPTPIRDWMTRRFDLSGRIIRMRLDWIAARGPWAPAPADPVWTGSALGPEGLKASDHAPIGVAAVRRGSESL